MFYSVLFFYYTFILLLCKFSYIRKASLLLMLQLSVAGLFLQHSIFIHIITIMEEKAENLHSQVDRTI